MNLTKAGVPTSGVQQVETAVIVGTISTAGDATVTVTGAGITGSPLAISVALALNDTDALCAVKIRAALNANAAVVALYVAGGTAANVSLTAIKAAANDTTLNIAYADDTCVGLTPDASSNNSTAGVRGDFRGAPTFAYALDSTANAIYQNTGTGAVPTWTEV